MRRSNGRQSKTACGRSSIAGCSRCSKARRRSTRFCAASTAMPDVVDAGIVMPSFRWSAVSAGGDVVSGVSEAPDQAAVVERLQRQGQIVLSAEPADRRSPFAELIQFELGLRRGLDKTTLGEVTRELAIMLGAGQDLDRALRFVVHNVGNSRARALLEEVRDKVRAGGSLASSVAAHPQTFSKLYVGLFRAGEAGGTLHATLYRLAA